MAKVNINPDVTECLRRAQGATDSIEHFNYYLQEVQHPKAARYALNVVPAARSALCKAERAVGLDAMVGLPSHCMALDGAERQALRDRAERALAKAERALAKAERAHRRW